ncbi:MAG: transposase [Gammaproteobacteria bacterium]|nr:transposase [Gammaproteobacteria bacterium]
MFRENEDHLQFGLFDTLQRLPEKVRQRLEASWADTFYREVFCRIDESPFAVLYSDQPSRPTTPINILVAAEILKSGFGWSDEELYDEIQFNFQVRYALGLRDMGEVPFELRTLYNFRQRLSQHMQETGDNLLDHIFVQVTDEQLATLQLKTGHQRMDSVLVSSNMRQMTRLHMLVEVVQRVWRMLVEDDHASHAEVFQPYRQGTAGQYCYGVKGDEVAAHVEAIGHVMHRLVQELAARYAEQPAYQVLERVFTEHFALVASPGEDTDTGQIRVKTGGELSASSLQSPDDWEATYREKRGQGYRGYVANLTETCDPENEVQLITQVQVTPNTTDDEQMAIDCLPALKARTDVESLWTDGGYNGPELEALLRQHQIEHIPTNVRGGRSSPDRLGLEAFSWETDEAGVPLAVTCPGGQRVEVRAGRKTDRFLTNFDQMACETCPLADQCPTHPLKRCPARVLRVRARQVQVAQLRQRVAQTRGTGNNWRAAVESTVRSVTHPFGGQAGKLPVRGQIRVSQVLICSGLMVNLRRIWRYEQQLARQKSQEVLSLLSRDWLCLRSWFHVQPVRRSLNFVPVTAKT